MLKRSPENEIAYQKRLEAISDPSSPGFERCLTNEQLGQYGPTQHDLAALIEWFTSKGLTAKVADPGHVFLGVEGTASKVSVAFATTIHLYKLGSSAQYAASSRATIPSMLEPIIDGVVGLSEEYAFPDLPARYHRTEK